MNTDKLITWLKNTVNKTWFSLLLLFFITLLAAGLRFFKLGEWSFWIDEIFTINHAQRHFSTLELMLENIPPARNWVPTSVILTAQVLNILGVNEWSARLVSALFGIFTIPILYFPTKKIFGNPVALVASLLLAVSPWHIYWSQNARGYTSLVLFYTLALFVFYQVIERDKPRYIILFFLLVYLASSERLIAVFILPVIILYLIFIKIFKMENPPGLRVRNLIFLISPALLLIVYQILSYFFSSGSSITEIVNEITSTFYGKSIENPITQTIFILFEIGIPMFVFALFSGLYWLTQKTRIGLFVFLGALGPMALVIVMTPFMFTEERYVLITLPCWLIMAAYGLKELISRNRNLEKIITLGVITLLIADAAGSYLLYFHINNGNRRDWKGAFAIVEENLKAEDIIVSTWPELGNFYLNEEVVLWQEMDLASIENSEHRTWFVVIPDMAWFTNTEDLYWWVEHNSRLIDILYLRTVDNANIEIYLYDPDLSSFIKKPN